MTLTDTSITIDKPDVLDRLAEGVLTLTNSERWLDWLKFQAQFHNYSFGNVMLILMQAPDATRVAGFHAWKKLGRSVRKGGRGLWILAPMVSKVDNDDGTKSSRCFGFKAVRVFDVSQTDGEELPEAPIVKLTGDDTNGAFADLKGFANLLGFTVTLTDELPGDANGMCRHLTKEIFVKASNAPIQRVKTLAHELGHSLLHDPAHGQTMDRGHMELEAESVAYVVCEHLGIESDEYSFGYVAHWSEGKNAGDLIKTSGQRIQKAAEQIIEGLK